MSTGNNFSKLERFIASSNNMNANQLKFERLY